MEYGIRIVTIIAVLIISYITIGLSLEKLYHNQDTVEELARRLRHHTTAVIKILFTKEKVRHVFDIALYEDICEILAEYKHSGFEIDSAYGIRESLPYYAIAFVPQGSYDDTVMQSITDLVLLKFRDYITLYDLPFLSFAAYHMIKGRLYIALYYSEFPEDMEPLKVKYKRAIVRKTSKNYGILRDPELDKELNLVD